MPTTDQIWFRIGNYLKPDAVIEGNRQLMANTLRSLHEYYIQLQQFQPGTEQYRVLLDQLQRGISSFTAKYGDILKPDAFRIK